MTADLKDTEILGYCLVEMIGEGGMASVWRAEHPYLGKVGVIKILDPLLARDEKLVERFMQEARVQVELEHPNITKVENFSREHLAILMEYVQGDSLSNIIGRKVGPIPFERALPYMKQILSALEHAHTNEIVHRDIKPSNVMITPEGTVKVTDFGIAKVVRGSALTQTGTTMGTAAYMSPEQIRGARDLDTRSDIYSIGVTFYEMLAGRPPFEGESGTDSDFLIKEGHMRKPPPDPQQFYPAIPDAIVAVLMRAMEKAPEDRFQTIAQFYKSLVQACNESMVLEGRNGKTSPLPPEETTIEETPVLPSSAEMGTAQRPPRTPEAQLSTSKKSRPQGQWIAASIGCVLLLLIAGLFIFRSGTSTPELANIPSSTSGARTHRNAQDDLEKEILQEVELSLYKRRLSVLRAIQKIEDMRKVTRQAATRFPQNQPSFWCQLAATAEEAGNYDLADEIYLEALKKIPGATSLLHQAAWFYATVPGNVKDPSKAIKLIRKARELGIQYNTKYVLAHAEALFRSHDREGALRELRAFLNRRRSRSVSRRLRELQSRSYDSPSVPRDKINPRMYILPPEWNSGVPTGSFQKNEIFHGTDIRARQLAASGHFNQAHALYKLALSHVNDENVRLTLQFGKADVLSRELKYDDAKKRYLSLFKKIPNNPRTGNRYAWFLLASGMMRHRQPQEALRVALKVNRLVSHPNPSYLHTLAEAFAQNNRMQDAIATLQKAIDLDPTRKLLKRDMKNLRSGETRHMFIKRLAEENARGQTWSSHLEELIQAATYRRLSRAEIEQLSELQRYVLRNGIFARHGYRFHTVYWLHKLVSDRTWYRPKFEVTYSHLNSTEQKNVRLIAKVDKTNR